MKQTEQLMTVEQPQKRSALSALAARLECDPVKLLSTLKNTVFKGATDDEMLALVVISETYQLNPFLKEIHAFPQKGGIVPVVGIDGWLKIINRQPDLDGLSVELSPDGKSATCTIHVKGRSHPTVITEDLEECYRGTEPWKTMPKRMLRHKAIIQAGRVAFGISGIHDEDEARDQIRNVTPRDVTPPKQNPFGEKPVAKIEVKETPEDKPAEAPPLIDVEVHDAVLVHLTGYMRMEKGTKRWHNVTFVQDGKDVTASTFSATIAEKAVDLMDGPAMIEYVPGKKAGFFELRSVEEVGA